MSTEIKEEEIKSLSDREVKEAIEAMLFAAGYPIETDKIAQILLIEKERLLTILEEMKEYYEKESRGIQLVFIEDSCQLCTKEKYEGYIRSALGIRQSGKLSNSCLEVLAIIAYNQPITKALIDEIRGVDSGYAIGVLGEKNLIESKGRLDTIGKPNLYGTTEDFLRVFGLAGLSELPKNIDLGMGEQTKLDI